ncbi:MAG TPA: rhomboid family intramembrane serine protease [bacterium]|jgi:membrane associated rhomboid family serine protease
MIPIRDENPARTFPLVTMCLIAVNVAVFIYQLTLPAADLHRFITGFGLIPAEILGRAPRIHAAIPQALTLITAQFLHGGIFHLLGNMLYLWIFGNNIEDLLGRFRFVIFYLLCGTLAAVAHIILNPMSMLPMVGASGAIAGVLGAYLVSFPRARITILIFVFFFVTTTQVPALVVLGLWFIMQLFYVLGDLGGGGANIAYMAHIGGFLAGLWLVRKFRPGLRWGRYGR